jgi:hypothetical protein
MRLDGAFGTGKAGEDAYARRLKELNGAARNEAMKTVNQVGNSFRQWLFSPTADLRISEAQRFEHQFTDAMRDWLDKNENATDEQIFVAAQQKQAVLVSQAKELQKTPIRQREAAEGQPAPAATAHKVGDVVERGGKKWKITAIVNGREQVEEVK